MEFTSRGHIPPVIEDRNAPLVADPGELPERMEGEFVAKTSISVDNIFMSCAKLQLQMRVVCSELGMPVFCVG